MSLVSEGGSGVRGIGSVPVTPEIGHPRTLRVGGSPTSRPAPAPLADAVREREEDVTRERLEEAVRDANANIEQLNRGLKFRVHEGTGELMVQIVDRGSGDVLRTNPPEEFLDLAVRMKEMVGLFLDETR